MGAGRPPIDIDWNKLDQMLVAGYNGVECAAEFGIHEQTLFKKVEDKYKMNFSNYAAIKYSKGDGMIKAIRFKKALEGNVPLIQYLSEYRLKDKREEKKFESELRKKENESNKIPDDYVEAFNKHMNQLLNSQSSDSSAVKTNIVKDNTSE